MSRFRLVRQMRHLVSQLGRAIARDTPAFTAAAELRNPPMPAEQMRTAVERLAEDPFGTTCLDCGEPIDDTNPYTNTADGELLHVECGEPCVCHTAFTCLAHDHEEMK